MQNNIKRIDTKSAFSAEEEDEVEIVEMKPTSNTFWQKLDNFLKESYLGKASKNQVRLVCGNATLIPDIRAECKITAPTSYLAAKSTVGTVPIL